ncbi:hypothetical protein Q3G72_028965 [Acer saccharum]|nr:hypothetical protein Q3G72_028965 [Acer saccharum]
MCDRNFGFGADGVIFSMLGINDTYNTMRIFNSDGNEPEAPGYECACEFIALKKLYLNPVRAMHKAKAKESSQENQKKLCLIWEIVGDLCLPGPIIATPQTQTLSTQVHPIMVATTQVAIKKLNSESMQGLEEWQSEGSLENHLFRRHPSVEPLSWDIRLKIAIGAARGLSFLHTSEKKVIYRDFKASNILLDGNYNAKISDFGLAKLGPAGGESHVTTRIMGTYGYAAPEYVATGHLYVKSDVYGFGVVLLEIMTGLRALDTKRPNGQQNLVEWLKPTLSHKRKLKNIMDGRMEGQYTPKAALQAAEVTLKCLESDPKNRPSMKEVLEVLEQIEAMKVKLKKSKYSSTQSTANRQPQPYIHHRSPVQ